MNASPRTLLELAWVTDPTERPFTCPACGATDEPPVTVFSLARVDVVHAHGCSWLRRHTG